MKIILLVSIPIVLMFGCEESTSSSGQKMKLEETQQGEVAELTGNEEASAEPEVVYPYRRMPIKENKLGYADRDGTIPVTDMELYLSMYSDEELAKVEYFVLLDTDVTELKGLERLPNLENLKVAGTGYPGKLQRIDNIPALEKLGGLNFAHNQIEVVPNLGHLPSLTHLNLQLNPIRELEGLLELTGMVSINIAIVERPPYFDAYPNDEFWDIFDQMRANNAETLESFDF